MRISQLETARAAWVRSWITRIEWERRDERIAGKGKE
jgi:hypothetical protein